MRLTGSVIFLCELLVSLVRFFTDIEAASDTGT